MAKTAAELYRKLFADLTDRPQDATEAVRAFISATKSVGTAIGAQPLGTVVEAGRTFVGAANAVVATIAEREEAQQLIEYKIWKAIIVKTYFDCVALVSAHMLRWGINEEVRQRYNAAQISSENIKENLRLLIEQGGVTASMELQMLIEAHSAEMKAWLGAKQAIANRGWVDFDDRKIDVLLNVDENQWTVVVLKKLVELTLNDVDTDDIAMRLQSYREPRYKSLKEIYQDGGMTTEMVKNYYRNLWQTIADLPGDKPMNLDLLGRSSRNTMFEALKLINVR